MDDIMLPRGVPVIGAPSRAEMGGGTKRPRTYHELERAGLIAPQTDPWLYFSRHPREAEIAMWLRAAGIDVRSVTEDDRRTPDAVFVGAAATVEFKTVSPGSVNPAEALYQRIRDARAQSPRVVCDVRGSTAGRNDCIRAVVRALRNGGRDLLEIVVVGDGFVLSWP